MRSRSYVLDRTAVGVCVAAALASVVLVGRAQDRVGKAGRKDPRVGLKAGLRDAGEAIWHLQLVAALGKPAGFVNPEAPSGSQTPPERDPSKPAGSARRKAEAAPTPPSTPPAASARPAPSFDPVRENQLSFWNSDLAFTARHMFVGNFHGFNIYDVETPKGPELLTSVVCPGGQGDVSVYRHLLIMSVEQVRGRVDCGTQGVQTPVSAERFRGVRIFDVTDIKRPRQVAAVQTCRGSHTHTLITDTKDPGVFYVYASGTSPVRSGEELGGCSAGDPKDDPNTALFSIDVIQVSVAAPQDAKIVNRPRIFADPSTGELAGLWKGGNHGDKTQTTSVTNQCHDITVFPSAGLAAGACSGNGILMDISDPVHPVRLDAVLDKNFAYWHSATFNNDGTKVLFTDEWGGGIRPRCRETDQPNWGANAIFDIVDRKLQFRGYYKMPAAQTETENCVAHNGSLVPVPGRDIMVQAWYQGGISVFDFTDSAHPFEIAYFDRGPIDAKRLYTGGYWSAYWHNGSIYAAEIVRGLDVFRLAPSEFLSQNEIAAAVLVHSDAFNAQQQPRVTWPATSEVARAYLDQLGRTQGIPAARAAAIRSTLGRADGTRGRDGTVAQQLESLSVEVRSDAAGASGRVARTLEALADTLKGRAARLR